MRRRERPSSVPGRRGALEHRTRARRRLVCSVSLSKNTALKSLPRERSTSAVELTNVSPHSGRPPVIAHETRGFPRRTAVGRAALGRNGGAIQVVMNTMFVRHLVSVYRAFGGDLVAAIVLGEVAHHNVAPLIGAAHTPRQLGEALRGKGQSCLGRSCRPTASRSRRRPGFRARRSGARSPVSSAGAGWRRTPTATCSWKLLPRPSSRRSLSSA